MMIVYYKALLAVYGETLFNQTFKQIYLMNWNIRQSLLSSVGSPQKAADCLIGDRGYFKNPDVDPATPWWQGENVIVLSDNKYYGHGVGIHNAQQIIRSLNSNRKSGSKTPAYFMDAYARPDFKTLSAVAQKSTAAAFSTRGPISWQHFSDPAVSRA